MAASGVPRRYPRLREVLERRIEEHADQIIDAQIEALKATRASVGEDGEVHVHPDFLTRARAGDMLVSRALGKPTQATEISGPDGAPLQLASTFDLTALTLAEKRELLRLAEKANAAAPVG